MDSVSSIKRVFMGELGVGKPDNGTKVIATDGLISCLGLSGFNVEENIGFVAHFSTPDQVLNFYSRGVEYIKTYVSEMESKMLIFDCFVVGGWSKAAYSHQILKLIREHEERLEGSNLKFVIEEGELLSEMSSQKSLSLNLETAIFKKYIPCEWHRQLSQEDEEYYHKLESLTQLKLV